jgi:hypothetical protein
VQRIISGHGAKHLLPSRDESLAIERRTGFAPKGRILVDFWINQRTFGSAVAESKYFGHVISALSAVVLKRSTGVKASTKGISAERDPAGCARLQLGAEGAGGFARQVALARIIENLSEK